MAKQHGIIPLTGSIGDITFYSRNGKFYARSRGSEPRQNYDPTHKAYEKVKENKKKFTKASLLASEFYNKLSRNQKKQKFFMKLQKNSMRMVFAGKSEPEMRFILQNMLVKYIQDEQIKKEIRESKYKDYKPKPINLPITGTYNNYGEGALKKPETSNQGSVSV